MKRYKIGKYIIDAESPVKAMKIAKVLDSKTNVKVTRTRQNITDRPVDPYESEDWTTMLIKQAVKKGKNSSGEYEYSGGASVNQVIRCIKRLGYNPHGYYMLPEGFVDRMIFFFTDSVIKDSWLSEQSKQQFNKIIESDKRAEKAGQAKFAGDKTKYEFMKEKMNSNRAKFKIGDIVETTSPKMIAKIIDVQFLPEYYYENSAWRYLLKVIDAPNTSYKPGDEYNFAVAEYEMKKTDKKSFNDSAIKDDIVSELPSELDAAKQYAKNANYQAVANICWGIVDKLKRMKLADADNSDIDYLSKEEEKAIADYKAAIANTKDPKLLRLFAHILNEEIEHLEELQSSEIHDAEYEAYLNGRLLKRGDELTDFRGGKAWFYGCHHPRKITVLTKQNDPTSTMEYYPSAFNVEIK